MRFYGLFGQSLAHSISPQIHRKIYEVAETEAAYKIFEIEPNRLKSALDAMTVLDIRGANVTIPYKETVIPLLDTVSPLAERLHSVNTIKQVNGHLAGFNTDYDGIALTFNQRNWRVKDQQVVLLGSGGASHAAAHYFKDQGARSICVVSRSAANQEGEWDYLTYDQLRTQSGDILVNCTPIGMYPNVDASPVDKDVIQSFQVIFDMTYNPVETLFLKWAKELGKESTNGLDMLVGQAMRSVEIWEDRTFTPNQVSQLLAYFRENWTGAL